MKVLIFGGNGYMGQEFLKIYPDASTPHVDIADQKAVAEILDIEKPDVVINCAGKTGRPNVDWCEDHKEETIRANVLGPLILNDECLKRGIYLVHISSGCIYEGDNGGRGFTEEDAPNFSGSFYSRTKLWSDQMLKDFPVLVPRLRMPFDGSDNPRSLITKIRKYTKILDVQNSLTYIPDFLEAVRILIERKKTGLYNIVNPGVISPFEIMTMYKDIVDPSHTFEKLTLDHLGDVVKAGRSNCLLSTEKLVGEGIELRPVQEVVQEALMSIKNNQH